MIKYLTIKHEPQNQSQINDIIEILGINEPSIAEHIEQGFGYISYSEEHEQYISGYLSNSYLPKCKNTEITYEAFIKLYKKDS